MRLSNYNMGLQVSSKYFVVAFLAAFKLLSFSLAAQGAPGFRGG
jgi:hypothetical protein